MSKNGRGSASLFIGIAVTLLGAAIAIGLGILVSGSASPLWALILAMWGMDRIRHAKKPALSGTVLGLVYLGLALVIFYLGNANVLWAMVLANWLIDYIE